MSLNTATLLVHCADQKGILASITEFIHKNNGNILYIDQHVDHAEKVFFLRAKWDLEGFSIPREKIGDYFDTLIGKKYTMKYELHFAAQKQRMAVFVSHLPHCIYDILSRQRSGEWSVEIPLIISNHDKLRHVANEFGVDYHVLTIDKDNKKEQEAKQLDLLEKYNIDFCVLARYMQVVSDGFIAKYPNKIINIHHSFLPAFPGARPYHSAYQRGVKLIGATSHYVTADLDAGPIIAQGVAQVTHKDTVDDMKRKGLDLEKIVLSNAIWSHLERRTLVYNNRTVVFD